MAAYEYTAKDPAGNELSGVYTNVNSVEMLRAELMKLGYVLVHAQRESRPGRLSTRVRQKDVASFAFKFAGMYSAGLSLVRCLEALEEQAGNQALKDILADVRHRVETGASLRNAFEPHRTVFGDFFLGMIEAGESSGELSRALDMSARYLEKRLELRQKIRGAFVYPIVVGVVCCIVVLAMLIFVVPMFSQLYARLHVELPGPTQALVVLSLSLRSCWWALPPSIASPCAGPAAPGAKPAHEGLLGPLEDQDAAAGTVESPRARFAVHPHIRHADLGRGADHGGPGFGGQGGP